MLIFVFSNDTWKDVIFKAIREENVFLQEISIVVAWFGEDREWQVKDVWKAGF